MVRMYKKQSKLCKSCRERSYQIKNYYKRPENRARKKMKTEKIMKLIEKCNHWQPDYKFACVDKNKLRDLLDSK